MPLIIITGLPSSGKTHRAQQILADFQRRIATATAPHASNNVTIQHVTSYHASIDPSENLAEDSVVSVPSLNPRDLIYSTAREEKTARAQEFSVTKRGLSRNNIVIADAPNYIKGFRYQMWCEAKAAGTRSVVVHTAAREDECTVWNQERIKAWNWEEGLIIPSEDKGTTQGPRVGKDVKGDLQPESHTAIYGDKLIEGSLGNGITSRSSSMGGARSDDDETSAKRDTFETMTLTSLYISDKQLDADTNTGSMINGDLSKSRAAGTLDTSPQQSTAMVSPGPPPPRASLPYAPETLRSLSMRYEPPSPFTRWDTPLFTIPSSDIHPPYQAIWDALFPLPVKSDKKAVAQLKSGEATGTKTEEVRRHAATVLPKATGAEALQTLESATADVVKILLANARERGVTEGEGGSLAFSVPDPKTGNDISIEAEVPLNTTLNQPALQRLRRKYTQIQRGGISHGQGYASGRAAVVKDFCTFLETEWNVE